jgi:predicted DNA-binding transcriptional regulator AlpA
MSSLSTGLSKDETPRSTGVGSSSVNEFCKLHGISRGTLYNLWKAGRGPRFMQLGSIRRIPHDAALEWQREQCGE